MKEVTEKLDQISSQLDALLDLVRKDIAFSLFREKVPMAAIGKKLHLAKSSVVEMLSGLKAKNKQPKQ